MQSSHHSHTLSFWSMISKAYQNPVWIVLLIWFIALSLRLSTVDWDQGNHLHPDERFLTMVTGSMERPLTMSEYLHQSTSRLNPANIGYKFFVYGTFPLVITKYVALYVGMDTYDSVYKVGRILSAVLDSLMIFILYRISKRLSPLGKNVSSVHFFASLAYALMVLPIQLSHFYTTDIFMHFFGWLSLLCIFELTTHDSMKKYYLKVLGSGIFLGFAIASKVSALYMLPLQLWVLAVMALGATVPTHKSYLYRTGVLLGGICLFAYAAYFSVRMANPYYFYSSSFFDLRIHPDFISSIQELNRFNNPEAWFPPGVQWIHKTKILFPLKNIAAYGVGYGIFIFVIVGLGHFAQGVIRTLSLKKWTQNVFILIGLVGWAFAIFLYQGTQYAFTMRYFVLIYPVLALLAGTGVCVVLRFITTVHMRHTFKALGYVAVIVLLLGWTISFMKIYSSQHTRTVASQWIYDNMPDGTPIAWEHWDDPLPLQLPTNWGKRMRGIELPVFGEDTDQKWNEIDTKLAEAHYYVLSSNRAWGSIPTVPERFPRQTAFYKKLFAGQTKYTLVKSFTSYPGLCLGHSTICFDLPDDVADEAFTVYDHPKVLIYKNTQYEH